jgi:hypothetical protein
MAARPCSQHSLIWSRFSPSSSSQLQQLQVAHNVLHFHPALAMSSVGVGTLRDSSIVFQMSPSYSCHCRLRGTANHTHVSMTESRTGVGRRTFPFPLATKKQRSAEWRANEDTKRPQAEQRSEDFLHGSLLTTLNTTTECC